MSTIKYTVGDSYPNLFDTVRWPGNVPTAGIEGVMIANGEEAGQFTGLLTPVSHTNTPSESTWSWRFDVETDDTVAEGSFKLCLRLIHEDGSIETIDVSAIAKVSECG